MVSFTSLLAYLQPVGVICTVSTAPLALFCGRARSVEARHHHPPALSHDDGTIYVGSLDSYLYAFDNVGRLKWKINTDGAIYGSPTVDVDGNIFVGSFSGYVFGISAEGKQLWSFAACPGYTLYSTPTVTFDETLLIGCGDGKLRAIVDAKASKQ